MAQKKRGAGRPTKYRGDETCRQAQIACRLGATDADLAEFFDVNEDTINEWKKKHPEFSESIKRAKTSADQEVETALHQRAVGYKRTLERLSKFGDVIECEEELPPDTVACIFWLKNRQPERWRDKQEVEHRNATYIVQFGLKEQ